jgi:outer membrane immunogenic protein
MNVAVAVAAALGSFAAAAPAVAGTWSGPYVGAFAGVASGSSALTTSVDCTVNGILCDPTPHYWNNGALIGGTASGRASDTAFTGGGFLGASRQAGRFVYGVEADFGAMPLTVGVGGSANTLNLGLYNSGTPSVFNVQAKAATEWLATARVRAGFLPAPNLLVYGTAGIAATELTVANAYSDNFNNGVGTGNVEASSRGAFRSALVLGVGAEWAFAAQWKLRAEYLHADFGALTTTGISAYPPQVADSNPITSTANLHADLVRVGLAYGF